MLSCLACPCILLYLPLSVWGFPVHQVCVLLYLQSVKVFSWDKTCKHFSQVPQVPFWRSAESLPSRVKNLCIQSGNCQTPGTWVKELLTTLTDMVPSFHKKICIQKYKQFQISPTKPLQPSLWDALKQAHYGGFKLCQPATDQLISEKFTRATSREGRQL